MENKAKNGSNAVTKYFFVLRNRIEAIMSFPLNVGVDDSTPMEMRAEFDREFIRLDAYGQ